LTTWAMRSGSSMSCADRTVTGVEGPTASTRCDARHTELERQFDIGTGECVVAQRGIDGLELE